MKANLPRYFPRDMYVRQGLLEHYHRPGEQRGKERSRFIPRIGDDSRRRRTITLCTLLCHLIPVGCGIGAWKRRRLCYDKLGLTAQGRAETGGMGSDSGIDATSRRVFIKARRALGWCVASSLPRSACREIHQGPLFLGIRSKH